MDLSQCLNFLGLGFSVCESGIVTSIMLAKGCVALRWMKAYRYSSGCWHKAEEGLGFPLCRTRPWLCHTHPECFMIWGLQCRNRVGWNFRGVLDQWLATWLCKAAQVLWDVNGWSLCECGSVIFFQGQEILENASHTICLFTSHNAVYMWRTLTSPIAKNYI